MKTKPKVKGNRIMKKIAALVLAVAMALPFAACSKKEGGGGTTSAGVQTEENRSGGALEILEKVWDGYTADEKFPATGGYGKYMKDGRPGKIDAGDAETLDFELGFPKSEASAIDDAASLMHMLNQNNYSC